MLKPGLQKTSNACMHARLGPELPLQQAVPWTEFSLLPND